MNKGKNIEKYANIELLEKYDIEDQPPGKPHPHFKRISD